MQDISRLPLVAEPDIAQAPGLVFAYRGGPGVRSEKLHPAALPNAIASHEGWVWVHVDLIDKRVNGWVSTICALPDGARFILDGHDSSLALGAQDGFIHGVVADVLGGLERQSSNLGRLHFAVSGRLLVTGRRHSLAAVEETRRALEAGAAPDDALALFGMIVLAFCRNTTQQLVEASAELDHVEDRLVADRLSDERQQLKAIRRLAVSLHRPVSTLVSLFDDEECAGWPLPKASLDMLARLATRLSRLDREIMTLNDRARLLQEEVASEIADDSNRSLRALAVMSALLLPGTLVAGVFGMNIEELPLAHTPHGLLAVLGLGAAATVLFYWLLRRAGASLRL